MYPFHFDIYKFSLTSNLSGEIHRLIDTCYETNHTTGHWVLNCFYKFTHLFGALTSADKDQKGRFSVPLLDVKTEQQVLDANQMLTLNCR